MERESRTSKYKELRDSIRQDAGLKHASVHVVDEEDDFLSFLPKESTRLSRSQDPYDNIKFKNVRTDFNTRQLIFEKVSGRTIEEEERLAQLERDDEHIVSEKKPHAKKERDEEPSKGLLKFLSGKLFEDEEDEAEDVDVETTEAAQEDTGLFSSFFSAFDESEDEDGHVEVKEKAPREKSESSFMSKLSSVFFGDLPDEGEELPLEGIEEEEEEIVEEPVKPGKGFKGFSSLFVEEDEDEDQSAEEKKEDQETFGPGFLTMIAEKFFGDADEETGELDDEMMDLHEDDLMTRIDEEKADEESNKPGIMTMISDKLFSEEETEAETDYESLYTPEDEAFVSTQESSTQKDAEATRTYETVQEDQPRDEKSSSFFSKFSHIFYDDLPVEGEEITDFTDEVQEEVQEEAPAEKRGPGVFKKFTSLFVEEEEEDTDEDAEVVDQVVDHKVEESAAAQSEEEAEEVVEEAGFLSGFKKLLFEEEDEETEEPEDTSGQQPLAEEPAKEKADRSGFLDRLSEKYFSDVDEFEVSPSETETEAQAVEAAPEPVPAEETAAAERQEKESGFFSGFKKMLFEDEDEDEEAEESEDTSNQQPLAEEPAKEKADRSGFLDRLSEKYFSDVDEYEVSPSETETEAKAVEAAPETAPAEETVAAERQEKESGFFSGFKKMLFEEEDEEAEESEESEETSSQQPLAEEPAEESADRSGFLDRLSEKYFSDVDEYEISSETPQSEVRSEEPAEAVSEEPAPEKEGGVLAGLKKLLFVEEDEEDETDEVSDMQNQEEESSISSLSDKYFGDAGDEAAAQAGETIIDHLNEPEQKEEKAGIIQSVMNLLFDVEEESEEETTEEEPTEQKGKGSIKSILNSLVVDAEEDDQPDIQAVEATDSKKEAEEAKTTKTTTAEFPFIPLVKENFIEKLSEQVIDEDEKHDQSLLDKAVSVFVEEDVPADTIVIEEEKVETADENAPEADPVFKIDGVFEEVTPEMRAERTAETAEAMTVEEDVAEAPVETGVMDVPKADPVFKIDGEFEEVKQPVHEVQEQIDDQKQEKIVEARPQVAQPEAKPAVKAKPAETQVYQEVDEEEGDEADDQSRLSTILNVLIVLLVIVIIALIVRLILY